MKCINCWSFMATTHHELLECKHATMLSLRKKSQVDNFFWCATQCKNNVYSQDSAYVTVLFKFAKLNLNLNWKEVLLFKFTNGLARMRMNGKFDPHPISDHTIRLIVSLTCLRQARTALFVHNQSAPVKRALQCDGCHLWMSSDVI